MRATAAARSTDSRTGPHAAPDAWGHGNESPGLSGSQLARWQGCAVALGLDGGLDARSR